MRMQVCETCAADDSFLSAARALLCDIEVAPVACMSGCTHPQAVSFREPGKVAYLFGDLAVDDLPDLARFARLYAASSDGRFEDARVLGDLRFKAIARIAP